MDANNPPIAPLTVPANAVATSQLKLVALTRKFSDNGVLLADPAPGRSVEEAVRILAGTGRPHLARAEIRGPEQVGDQVTYTLHRQVGTKGLLAGMTTAAKRAVVAQRIQSKRNLATFAKPEEVETSDPAVAVLAFGLAERQPGDTALALPSVALPWTF